MKKALFIVLIALTLFNLTGCSKYRSSYKAVILVTTNTSSKASMKFHSFEGTYVFKLKNKKDGGILKYSGSLDAGALNVYYDNENEKTHLFSIKQDDSDVSSSIEGLEKGTIYIIVETSMKCADGELSFELE